MIKQLRGGEVAVAAPEHRAPRTRRLKLPRIYRAIAGNIGVSLVTQACLLLSGVAGARILGVLDRGRSALLLLFATVLPLIGTLGTPLAATYWIARDKGSGIRVLRTLRGVITAQTAGLIVVHACVLLVVFNGAPGGVQVAAAISLFATPAIVAFFYALAVLQGTQDFRTLNLCMLIFPPLNAGILVAILLVGARGLWLVTAIWVAGYLLSASVSVIAARRSLRKVATADGRSEPARVGEMVRFGLKALLGSMSPLTGFQLDQAIVGLFISQIALGIYVVAVAFTNLPRFVAQAVGLVAYPHVAADGNEHGRAREIVKFVGLAVVLCGAIILATELALPFVVPVLFGKAFSSAVAVGRILLISTFLFCVTRVLSDCSRGAGRPALGTFAEIASLTTLFPFVVLLSSSGAQGVAVALALSAACGLGTIVVGLAIPRLRRAAAVDAPALEAADA